MDAFAKIAIIYLILTCFLYGIFSLYFSLGISEWGKQKFPEGNLFIGIFPTIIPLLIGGTVLLILVFQIIGNTKRKKKIKEAKAKIDEAIRTLGGKVESTENNDCKSLLETFVKLLGQENNSETKTKLKEFPKNLKNNCDNDLKKEIEEAKKHKTTLIDLQ